MVILQFFILILVGSTMAGEILEDEGGDEVNVETVNNNDANTDNNDKNAFVFTNTTKEDKSGLEPNIPYSNDLTNSYGGTANSYGSFQCPSIRYRNKCYFLALSQESWYTGRDYCRRIGQTLARIESSDEAAFLGSYLYEANPHWYWVDATDEMTEGVWTTSDNQVVFTDWWGPNEPNGNRGENCGLMVIGQDRIGRLVDDPCREWRRYICERRTDSVCRRAGYRSKCYWFSAQRATWFNAREYCASIGQRLARVTSTDEANFLARVMPRPSWIDLRSTGQGIGWTMSDGTAGLAGLFGPEFMGFFGGGARCAELRRYNTKEGRGFVTDCNMPRHFVCEGPSLPPGAETVNPEDLPIASPIDPMGEMMGVPPMPGMMG